MKKSGRNIEDRINKEDKIMNGQEENGRQMLEKKEKVRKQKRKEEKTNRDRRTRRQTRNEAIEEDK